MKIESTSSVSKKDVVYDRKFPWIGIRNSFRVIVLFKSLSEGTVIESDRATSIGFHSSSWIPSEFEPYYGTVTITSKEDLK